MRSAAATARPSLACLRCLAFGAAGGCRPRTVGRGGAAHEPAPTAHAQPAPAASGVVRAFSAPSAETTEPPPRPLRRCFSDRPAWLDAPVASLLDRAAELFDDADYTGALACAEEAARQAPRSVEAHHNRAISLMRLDRLDEARDAIALALALAPDDPETLEAAADLNINQLPPSVDRSALGLEYARRGSRHVGRRDRERIARLALLEGQALIDLGRAIEALQADRRRAEGVAALRGRRLRTRRRAVRAVPFRGSPTNVREGAGGDARSRPRAVPPRPDRGASRRGRAGRAPSRRGERGRRQVVPAAAWR